MSHSENGIRRTAAETLLSLPPLTRDMAFFLDLDGTLLEHVAHPQAVHADASLLRLLGALSAACGGALALISGRSIEDIDRLLAPLALPAAGQHGTELRLPQGTRRRDTPVIDKLGHAAADIVRLTAAHEGLVFENKGMTLALHYRMAPHLQDLAVHSMRGLAAALGGEFELQEGKFVVEIKPSGKDKGTAINEFMNEAPFAGRQPVFVGDDLTDEYGFAAVNAMGGHAVKVGTGETRARWRAQDSVAVLAWLGEFAGRFGNRPAVRTTR